MEKKFINSDIVIIGAGLTGLTLAYLMRNSGKNVVIVEARNRLGGRILTKGIETDQPIEMGATWIGNQHQRLRALLQELNIGTFDQVIGNAAIYEAISTSPHYLATLPPNPEPSIRVQGGTEQVIKALVSHIDKSNILLDQPVSQIISNESGITVHTKDHIIESQLVVSTLPPNLLVRSIDCKPSLPSNLIELAQTTHTWMGESIKIALTYAEPFWRDKNLSGTIMSNIGPIGEMYDHSNYEDSFYALKGFFSGNYFSISREERLAMIMRQLNKYFGNKAEKYLTYEEVVWRNEPYSFTPYNSHVLPHQNNGHQLYQQPYMDEKLIIGGTETSTSYPGYMEGAVYSALSIANRILK